MKKQKKNKDGKVKDKCEICKGERGGIPGNENIVKGTIICDYCHADYLKDRKEKTNG